MIDSTTLRRFNTLKNHAVFDQNFSQDSTKTSAVVILEYYVSSFLTIMLATALTQANEWVGRYSMSLYTGGKIHCNELDELPIDDDVIHQVERFAEGRSKYDCLIGIPCLNIVNRQFAPYLPSCVERHEIMSSPLVCLSQRDCWHATPLHIVSGANTCTPMHKIQM